MNRTNCPLPKKKSAVNAGRKQKRGFTFGLIRKAFPIQDWRKKMAKTFCFTTKYCNDYGVVALGHYGDNSLAIRLMTVYGQPLATPTVNLQQHGEKPADGNVFIRDYAENEGMYECLKQLGIVGESIREITFGFGKARECPFILPLEQARLL